jgi:alkylation response protein AidB-like acyl-CoA dehydrogenase
VATLAHELSDTHRAIRAMAREFAEAEIAPHAEGWSERHHVPVDVIRRMGELGLLGIIIPEEYGGAGLDDVSMCLVVEEIARADAGTSVALCVQNGLAARPIMAHGTEAQRERWLPPLASGERFGAYGLTEPDIGSDVGALRTTAVPHPDGGWRAAGTKTWITNGGFADVFVLFARIPDLGITAFLTEPGEGFTVGRELRKMGLHSSSTVELSFDGHPLPGDALLGEPGKGMRVALSTLDGGRITIAAQACGIAAAALDLACEYAGQRTAFGGPIARFQGVSFPIAEIAARLDAARLLTHHAARVRDAGGRHTVEGAKAKLVASQVAVDAANVCVQTLGGYGYSAEYAAERYYRDAKITQLYEGTSEIQRLVIARDLLGDATR